MPITAAVPDAIWESHFQRLPSQIAMTPDGSFTAVALPNRVVTLLDKDGRRLWEKQIEAEATCVALTLKAEYIAACSPKGVFVFDRNGQLLRLIKAVSVCAAISEDGTLVAVAIAHPGKRTGGLFLFDTRKKALLHRQAGAVVWRRSFDEPVHSIVASFDSDRLLVCFARHLLCLDTQQNTVFDHKATSTIKGIAATPDFAMMALSTFDGHLVCLDGDAKMLFSTDLGEELGPVACEPEGNWIIVGSKARPVVFLVNSTGESVWRFAAEQKPVHLAVTRGGSSFVVSYPSGKLVAYRNYYIDLRERVQRAVKLLSDRQSAQVALRALAASGREGVVALSKAIKKGALSETQFPLIARFPEAALSLFLELVVTDREPGRLLESLAAFYQLALPGLLRCLNQLSDEQCKEFFTRVSAAAAKSHDARLSDLLGLIHRERGQLDKSVRHFVEATKMPNATDEMTEHLKDALESIEQMKSTTCIDELLTTFVDRRAFEEPPTEPPQEPLSKKE